MIWHYHLMTALLVFILQNGYYSTPGIIPLLVGKILFFKASLLLGPPIALGAFVVGQGTGLLLGKVIGISFIINRWLKLKRLEAAAHGHKFHGGHFHLHGGRPGGWHHPNHYGGNHFSENHWNHFQPNYWNHYPQNYWDHYAKPYSTTDRGQLYPPHASPPAYSEPHHAIYGLPSNYAPPYNYAGYSVDLTPSTVPYGHTYGTSVPVSSSYANDGSNYHYTSNYEPSYHTSNYEPPYRTSSYEPSYHYVHGSNNHKEVPYSYQEDATYVTSTPTQKDIAYKPYYSTYGSGGVGHKSVTNRLPKIPKYEAYHSNYGTSVPVGSNYADDDSSYRNPSNYEPSYRDVQSDRSPPKEVSYSYHEDTTYVTTPMQKEITYKPYYSTYGSAGGGHKSVTNRLPIKIPQYVPGQSVSEDSDLAYDPNSFENTEPEEIGDDVETEYVVKGKRKSPKFPDSTPSAAEQYILKHFYQVTNQSEMSEEKKLDILADLLQDQFDTEILDGVQNRLKSHSSKVQTTTTTTTTTEAPKKKLKFQSKPKFEPKKEVSIMSSLGDVMGETAGDVIPESFMEWLLDGKSKPDLSEEHPEMHLHLNGRRIKREVPSTSDLEVTSVTESFIQDIKNLFSIVSFLDINRCLEKMVCEIHSGDRGTVATDYEKNIITAFRVMDKIMPIGTVSDEADSTIKYRQAAHLGQKVVNGGNICGQLFSSCGISTGQIIQLGNIGGSNPILPGGSNTGQLPVISTGVSSPSTILPAFRNAEDLDANSGT